MHNQDCHSLLNFNFISLLEAIEENCKPTYTWTSPEQFLRFAYLFGGKSCLRCLEQNSATELQQIDLEDRVAKHVVANPLLSGASTQIYGAVYQRAYSHALAKYLEFLLAATN